MGCIQLEATFLAEHGKRKPLDFANVLHLTARESNDRQTFDFMNPIKFNYIQSQCLC